MKVLVAIPCLLTGGTEIQTLNLVQALIASGYEVLTVCYFEHTPDMVARYRDAGSEVLLLSPEGTRPVGVKATVSALCKGLRKVVKEYRPDVAHVQYMAPGALPILILKLLGVKKIVATSHTPADIYPSLRELHFIEKHVLTAFQCITLRAEESFFGTSRMFGEVKKLKKHGNHFTIYNALPSYISIRETPRQFGKPLTIGVVSRLEEIKGMDLVVPAFAKIHEQYPDTRLLIVGDGAQRELMERQTAKYGFPEGTVSFEGRQPQDALQDYYDRIDILLMPSRSEGFGLTAIEGMARGCVVVASDTGGLPEVVTPEVGLLHAPESVESIAAAVSRLLTTPAKLPRLSAAALRHAAKYSQTEYQKQIKNLYLMF